MSGLMRKNCSRGCCPSGSRAEDKRIAADWQVEYDTDPRDALRLCPKGGDTCLCNHLDRQ